MSRCEQRVAVRMAVGGVGLGCAVSTADGEGREGQDETYEAYLPQLAKLAFLSSAVHQTVFLLCSTLPFAVGQVQDVGLIFLSAMASSIAARCAAQVRPLPPVLETFHLCGQTQEDPLSSYSIVIVFTH